MTVLVSAVYAGRDPRPTRAVLHEYGATIKDVAEEIARRAGPGAVLFGGMDQDALAAIGIDRVVFRAGSPHAGRPPGASHVRAEGGASALMLLRRAHQGTFDDALWAVINKGKQRNAAEAG